MARNKILESLYTQDVYVLQSDEKKKKIIKSLIFLE